MKKLFYNEDGTLKVINIVVLVDIIVAILLLFMVKSIYGSLSNSVDIKKKTTTSMSTTTIDLCNGCKIAFNRDVFNVNPQNVYPLEEILNLEKVNIKYVKFDISDEKLAKITVKNDKVSLEIFNSLGNFTLTASYYSQKSSIDVSIDSDRLIDIELEEKIFYVKNGEKKEIKYEFVPKGFNTTNLEKKIGDTSIVDFDSEGNLVGKKLGKTTLTLSCGDVTKVVPIYVVNSNITVKVKDNFLFRDLEYVTYDKMSDSEILLILENTNFSNNDLTYEIISDDDMTVDIKYSKKNTEYANAYEYILKVGTNDPEKSIPEKGATIIFTLPDGSKRELRIEVGETKE